jgi:hypothetical protein
MKRALLMLTGAFSVALLAHGATVASADTPCDYRNGNPQAPQTINGNVIAGPGCNLSYTRVYGNVTVTPGGSLVVGAESPVWISGNVTSRDAGFVEIRAGWIGGNVTIDGTTEGGSRLGLGVDGYSCNVPIGPIGSSAWPTITIGGDVNIRMNLGGRLYVESAKIGGDIYVTDNTVNSSDGDWGLLIVCQNSVGGRVVVSNNRIADSMANVLVISENVINRSLYLIGNLATDGTEVNDLAIVSNIVRGFAVLYGNTAGSAIKNFIDVADNTITWFLDCRNNTPAPSDTETGIGNTFHPQLRFFRRFYGPNRRLGGQCAGLTR